MGSPFFQPFDPTRPSDDVDYNYHHSRSKYDLNSRIMLTAIISLSAIVILVLALHIYARYFLRRQARRRGDALRRLGLSVSRARSAETGPTALPKRGLDPSLIASLPLLPFSPAADSSLECAVCLGALEAGELVRPLPACGHAFHAACIDTWLAGQSTCPVCRAEVDPTPRQPPVLRPEPREAPTAPSMGSLAASSSTCMEMETTSSSSDQQAESNSKALCNGNNGNGGSNRLSLSFRRILSRDRSSARIQPQLDQDVIEDLERQ